MTILLSTILIFLDLLTRLIIFDIVLSWMTLLWFKLRPAFLASIIDPLYKTVKSILPTRIWVFDLTPIIIFILIFFIRWLLFFLFPELTMEVQALISSI